MKSRIVVIVDSAASLRNEISGGNGANIMVVPFHLQSTDGSKLFGNTEPYWYQYQQDRQLSTEQAEEFNRLNRLRLLKVSSPSYEQWLAAFYKANMEQADTVIALPTSSGLCRSFENADRACNAFLTDNKSMSIYVVDTKSVSAIPGMVTEEIFRMLQSKIDVYEVAQQAERLCAKSVCAQIVTEPSSLKAVKQLSHTDYLLASWFGSIPILTLNHNAGRLSSLGSKTSWSKARDRAIDYVTTAAGKQRFRLAVTYDEAKSDQLDDFIQKVLNAFSVERRKLYLAEHSPVLSCFCGKGSIGLSAICY